MARPEKVAVVEAVRDELTGSAATLLTEYRGLTVSELAELRAELRKAGARYRVAKNTLMRLAARDAGLEGLEELFVGPTALTFCDEDPVGPAKALRRFSKDHPELVIKGGLLEGEVLDAAAASRLADLESREELLAKLAGLMYGALANFASLLEAPLAHMARLLAALEAESADEAPDVQAPGTGAEPVEPEDQAETAAEPVVPEDQAETAAEPVVPEDQAETAAEAVDASTPLPSDAEENSSFASEGSDEGGPPAEQRDPTDEPTA